MSDDCKLVAINLSLKADNVSPCAILFAINVSQKLSCLQAGAIIFASRNIYGKVFLQLDF